MAELKVAVCLEVLVPVVVVVVVVEAVAEVAAVADVLAAAVVQASKGRFDFLTQFTRNTLVLNVFTFFVGYLS